MSHYDGNMIQFNIPRAIVADFVRLLQVLSASGGLSDARTTHHWFARLSAKTSLKRRGSNRFQDCRF